VLASRNRIRRSKIQREAEGYLELGMPSHALKALSRLGDPGVGDAQTLYLHGEALRALERYDDALIPLQLAAEAEPENLHVWLALGWCFKRTDQIEEAIESLEAALVADPSEAIIHYNLACYWSLAGDKDSALRYLAQALSIDPDCRQLIDEEPDFDPIRYDPDFQALLGQTGAMG